jgi:hypothetical protein
LGDLGIDGRIILKLILRNLVGEAEFNCSDTIEIGSGVCECGNEHSGSKKCGEFLN